MPYTEMKTYGGGLYNFFIKDNPQATQFSILTDGSWEFGNLNDFTKVVTIDNVDFYQINYSYGILLSNQGDPKKHIQTEAAGGFLCVTNGIYGLASEAYYKKYINPALKKKPKLRPTNSKALTSKSFYEKTAEEFKNSSYNITAKTNPETPLKKK